MKAIMIKISLLIAFVTFGLASQAQVFVDGIVYHYTEDDKPIQVTVMEDDQFYKSIETSKGGKFRVRLQPNHFYVLNFSKPDHYITKIAVNTDLPFDPGPDFYTEIPLEADLVRKYVDMDPEVMKKPLSIFSYDAASETFIQDDEYLQKARAQLEAFLYEVEGAKKRDNEELATTTPEKSPEDADSLNPDLSKTDDLADNSNFLSNNDPLLDDKNNDDTGLKNDLADANEDKENNARAKNRNTLASNTVSGPSAPQIESQNQSQNNQEDTTQQDSAQVNSDLSENQKNYNINVVINGKTYDPNSSAPMEVNNDLDIDINGLQKEDYQDFQFQLSGKDNSFKNLTDDELEYDQLEKGSYTFVLKTAADNSFEDIRVPIEVTEEESDFPWILVILGLIVLVLIIIFSRKRRRRDLDDDRIVVERRDIDSTRDIDNDGDLDSRNNLDDRT